MAAPIFAEFPPAPSRSEGSEDFSKTADAFAAALPPFALKMNLAITWMADTMTATSGYKDAAAASANLSSQAAVTSAQARDAAQAAVTAATQAGAAQVALAAQQVALAVAAKDTAQTYAVAAGASSGVGQLGNAGDALVVNATRTGMMFAPASSVGDILISARNPGLMFMPANGGIRARSSAPTLLGVLGLLGGQVGQQYATLSAGTTAAVIDVASAPNPNGGAPLVMQATGTVMNFSADGGATWVAKTTPWGVQATGTTTSLAYDEYRSLWLATISGTSSIAMSANNGDSWTTSSTAAAITATGRICADANGVWIATSSATATLIVRSTDMGATWSSVTTGATAIHTAISTDNKGVWCICAGTTLRRSIDGGQTWTIVFTISGTLGAVSNDRNGTWMAGLSSSSTAMYRSTDNGLSFYSLTIATAVVTDIAYTQGFFFIVRSVSPQLMMISSSADTATFTIPTTAVLASLIRVTAIVGYVVAVNSANTTVLRSTPIFAYDPATQFQLPNFPVGAGLTAWVKAGLALASSGRNFNVTSLNMAISPSDMATDDKGVIIAVGTGASQPIRRSTDFGVTWTTVANPTGSNLFYSVATDKNGVWLIGGSGSLLRSTDNGATFVVVACADHGFVGPILQLVIGNNSVVCGCIGSGYMRRSANLGLTWTPLSALASGAYRACTDGAGKWVVVQGTTTSRSVDNLQSFITTSSVLAVAATDVKMTINGRVYLCGASTAAKVSNDYGVTWSDMTLPVAGLKFAVGSVSIVICYGSTTSRYSVDGGLNWATSGFSTTLNVITAGVNSPFIASTSVYPYVAAIDTIV